MNEQYAAGFETLDIALSPDLRVGVGAEDDMDGVQLKRVIASGWIDPEGYQYLEFEKKLELADAMIARWHRYRALVVEEKTENS